MVKILSLLFKTLGEEGIQNRQGSRIPGQKWYKSKQHQVTFNNILYFKWSAPDSERGRVPHSKKQFLDTSRVSRNSTPFSYYRVSRKIIHHHWVRSQMCSDHSFSALRQLIVYLVGLQIMRLIWNIFISFHLKHWKYCLCKSLQISSFASCWEVFLPSPPQHPLFLSFLKVWFKDYLLLGGPLTASFIIMVKLSAYSLLIFSPCQCGPQWSFMQP